MYYYYSDFTMFSTLYTISECIIIILTSLCSVLYIPSQNVLLLYKVCSTPFKYILSVYTFKNKRRQLHLCIPTCDGAIWE